MKLNLKNMVLISALGCSNLIYADHATQNNIDTKLTHTESGKEKLAIAKQNISESKRALMSRLSGFEHFSASFSQQVIDEENNVLQEGKGKIAVKKPNLVSWETQYPEESLIVSDGDTLWFFDPFIEQATAYRVDASVANTPILLLTSSDEGLWAQYSVSQSNTEHFLIHANDPNSRVKTLELNFIADSATLESFSILDTTGQLSVIKLSDVTMDEQLPLGLFNFTLPEGVYLDDQR